MKMIKELLALLKECEEDVDIVTFQNGKIKLIFYDFEGFDENWHEIMQDYKNPEGVNNVLNYLDRNAKLISDGLYQQYKLEDTIIKVGFTSFDI